MLACDEVDIRTICHRLIVGIKGLLLERIVCHQTGFLTREAHLTVGA